MPEHDCLPPDVGATEFVTHMARISGLPRTAARERTAEVLRHVGLYEERYRQIGGYSTGMKQRVKLAQALVHDPKLLLLDEPTNGLDPAGRDEMLDLIKRTGTDFGIAVVVASHLLGEIEQVCTLPAGDRRRPSPPARRRSRTSRSGRRSWRSRSRRAPTGWPRRWSAAALEPRQDGGCVLVALEDDALYDAVRDAVADLGLPLVRIQQERAPPRGPVPRRRRPAARRRSQ